MYKITHLRYDMLTGSNGAYLMEPTDYDHSDDHERLTEIVTELNRDAIESSSDDRWIVEAK